MNDITPNSGHAAATFNIDPNAPAPAAPAPAALNADGTPVTPAAVPTLPEGGVEKFYNAETGDYNWQGHATELAFQQAQKNQTPADATPAPAPAGDEGTAQTAVEAAGLDWNELSTQVAETGVLTDDQYAAFEKIGIPRADVEAFVQHRHEAVQTQTKNVTEGFGGEAGFAQIQQWAQANLNDAERDALNIQLNGPTWEIAVDHLRARAGLPPRSTGSAVSAPNQAGTPSSDASQGYASEGEMVTEMRDPRYKTDPGFRAQVLAKAQKSNFDTNPRAHTAGI